MFTRERERERVMVEIKEGILIGESSCLGVTPGATETEVVCSFHNGMIAVYDVS